MRFPANILGHRVIPGWFGADTGELLRCHCGEFVMIDGAGGGKHHFRPAITFSQVIVQAGLAEAANRFRRSQDRTADGLIWPGRRLEEIEGLIFRRIVRRPDFLKDDMLFASQFFRVEGRVLENIRKKIDCQWQIFGKDTCIIVRVLDAGCRVQFTADGLDFLGDAACAPGLCPLERHMFQKMGDAVLFRRFGA